MAETIQEKTERALKYQIGRQSAMKRNAQEESEYFRDKLFKTVKAVFDDDDSTISVLNAIKDELWEWVEMKRPRVKANSQHWGIKTEIGEYVSKSKKTTFLAHFSVYKSYLGKVSELGEVPIYYQGMFPIDREHFKISTVVPNAKRLEDFFVIMKK